MYLSSRFLGIRQLIGVHQYPPGLHFVLLLHCYREALFVRQPYQRRELGESEVEDSGEDKDKGEDKTSARWWLSWTAETSATIVANIHSTVNWSPAYKLAAHAPARQRQAGGEDDDTDTGHIVTPRRVTRSTTQQNRSDKSGPHTHIDELQEDHDRLTVELRRVEKQVKKQAGQVEDYLREVYWQSCWDHFALEVLNTTVDAVSTVMWSQVVWDTEDREPPEWFSEVVQHSLSQLGYLTSSGHNTHPSKWGNPNQVTVPPHSTMVGHGASSFQDHVETVWSHADKGLSV
ncbi:hypothetical protein C8J57DRAFT_1253338 [Mycena rebaudengoi]|nr:hypothetical protein C8J57DRAFT_1253338 [Mycena rebaudengoi]